MAEKLTFRKYLKHLIRELGKEKAVLYGILEFVGISMGGSTLSLIILGKSPLSAVIIPASFILGALRFGYWLWRYDNE